MTRWPTVRIVETPLGIVRKVELLDERGGVAGELPVTAVTQKQLPQSPGEVTITLLYDRVERVPA